MEELQKLSYITYTLEPGTKILTYRITDWVLKCSGAECCDGVVYTTDGYGFLCIPRNITERLAEQGRVFDESDAWLDLWCHTVYRDYGNAFSFEAPAIQYGKFGSVWRLFPVFSGWRSVAAVPVPRGNPGQSGFFPGGLLSGADTFSETVSGE